MTRFVVQRLLSIAPVLVLAVAASFLLVSAMPGDAANVIAAESPALDPQVIRHELGLDRPVLVRFWDYVVNVLHGDLGTSVSFRPGQGVGPLLATALPATLSVGALALLIAVVVAVPVGAVAATRSGSRTDRLISSSAAVAMSTPPFVVGLLLVIVFAHWLGLFPAVGYVPLGDGFGPWLQSVTLPAVTLALISTAEIARQVRGSLIDTLGKSHIRTARAKGLRGTRLLLRHASLTAGIEVVTVIGLQVVRIISGTVAIEVIFGIGGVGTLVVSAVTVRDVSIIQGVVLLSTVLVVAANFLTDLSYAYFDPKIRRQVA